MEDSDVNDGIKLLADATILFSLSASLLLTIGYGLMYLIFGR